MVMPRLAIGLKLDGREVLLHYVHRIPDVIRPKFLLLVADGLHPLVADGKSLNNDVLVPLLENRLHLIFEKLAAFVQDKQEAFVILAGMHPRVD